MPQFDQERFVPATCTHSRFGKRGTLVAVDCKKGLSSCKLTPKPQRVQFRPPLSAIDVMALSGQNMGCSLCRTLVQVEEKPNKKIQRKTHTNHSWAPLFRHMHPYYRFCKETNKATRFLNITWDQLDGLPLVFAGNLGCDQQNTSKNVAGSSHSKNKASPWFAVEVQSVPLCKQKQSATKTHPTVGSTVYWQRKRPL